MKYDSNRVAFRPNDNHTKQKYLSYDTPLHAPSDKYTVLVKVDLRTSSQSY
jgi:hypothetical protein